MTEILKSVNYYYSFLLKLLSSECINRVMLSKEQFIRDSSEKHQGKYDYSLIDFKDSRFHVNIVCPLHGEFFQRPSHHKNGQGCPVCKKRLTKESFVIRATDMHGNKYSYEKLIYSTNRTPVTITCSIHGDFKQSPSSHMKGHGCKSCNLVGTYNNTYFQKKDNMVKSGKLYIVKLFNTEENFYKIGITTKSIQKRFEKDKGYAFSIIRSIDGNLYTLFKIEQSILKQFIYRHRYTPKISLGGSRECFSEEMLNQVLSSLDDTTSSLIPSSL